MFRDICLDVPVCMSSLIQIHSSINKVSNYCHKLVLLTRVCGKYGNCFSLLRPVILCLLLIGANLAAPVLDVEKKYITHMHMLDLCVTVFAKKWESNAEFSKWFEPRSIISSYSVIVRQRVKRTVVGDWRFDKLSGRVKCLRVCIHVSSDLF